MNGDDGSGEATATLDDDLRVTGCERCPALVESRSRIVNGVGPTDASLVFLGEAPGQNEDEQGEPFVGRSGDVLDEALRAAGLVRSDVRITNCVRCRPPDNRDPSVEELSNCRGYLAAELNRIDPELLVTLGKVPSQHVLDRDVAITAEAGSVVDARIGDASRRVLLSVHPAATLYDRSQREGFFESIAEAARIAGIGSADDANADTDGGSGGGPGDGRPGDGGNGGGQSRLGEF
ncbi:DNA polymerase [Halopenitus malekzadehii]|uniref:Type-4 uracil-DNA glycosylase n=1 Tax=Halopenitus malekzadehii TaxID=1267564 RepID=A0A1H6HQZ5_9EURY|nr:uracil-DNA glycosylase [Halopenitus malekzadehii]SEH36594.1 DNA polymerase [Halopenitus malekzadehii]